jgi:hypothetical protein
MDEMLKFGACQYSNMKDNLKNNRDQSTPAAAPIGAVPIIPTSADPAATNEERRDEVARPWRNCGR